MTTYRAVRTSGRGRRIFSHRRPPVIQLLPISRRSISKECAENRDPGFGMAGAAPSDSGHREVSARPDGHRSSADTEHEFESVSHRPRGRVPVIGSTLLEQLTLWSGSRSAVLLFRFV